MLNIMVCCANGSGTSLMMKMTADKVVKALNIKVGKMHHCSLSEGKSAATQYDIVFCPLNFIDMFKEAERKRNDLTDTVMSARRPANLFEAGPAGDLRITGEVFYEPGGCVIMGAT